MHPSSRIRRTHPARPRVRPKPGPVRPEARPGPRDFAYRANTAPRGSGRRHGPALHPSTRVSPVPPIRNADRLGPGTRLRAAPIRVPTNGVRSQPPARPHRSGTPAPLTTAPRAPPKSRRSPRRIPGEAHAYATENTGTTSVYDAQRRVRRSPPRRTPLPRPASDARQDADRRAANRDDAKGSDSSESRRVDTATRREIEKLPRARRAARNRAFATLSP